MNIKELRTRLQGQYEKVLRMILPNLDNLGDLLDNKEEVVKELGVLEQEIRLFKEQVNIHKELRHGNVLNALSEAEILVNDGKGSLEKVQKVLVLLSEEKTLNDFQTEFGAFRAKQETLMKFLEADAHQPG